MERAQYNTRPFPFNRDNIETIQLFGALYLLEVKTVPLFILF